jgi:hypothetical protein
VTLARIASLPDPPGRAGGELLTGDEPVGEPPVDGGDPDAQFGRCLGDADHVAIMTGWCGSLAERGDAVVAAHLGDPGLGECQAGAGAAVLAGEHARDRRVVVVRGEAADEVHGGGLGGAPRAPSRGSATVRCVMAPPSQDSVSALRLLGVALWMLHSQSRAARKARDAAGLTPGQ